MPLYLYKCPTCAAQRDIFKPIAELDRVENCHKCNFAMNRQIVAPMVKGDYPGYTCPVTGTWIEGRRAHEENLKKHGCRILEAGETENVRRSRAQEDAALDAAVEATVDQFVAELPAAKREKLVAEVEGGFTADVVRTTPGE